jgi:hypothetical protein
LFDDPGTTLRRGPKTLGGRRRYQWRMVPGGRASAIMAGVPGIIEYSDVLQRMQSDGYRSLYHNSGAFGFVSQTPLLVAGWTLAEDPSIRPEMTPLVRRVEPAEARTLAELATRFWQAQARGPAWVMPLSHWAFELDHGSAGWMPAALSAIGLDPGELAPRVDGSAIEFGLQESPLFRGFVHDLLEHLTASDFLITFPGLPLLCTIHHHRQLWWQTTDERLAGLLRELPEGS